MNSKLAAQFQSMEVRNSNFAAFIDVFTSNTYVMVVTSDSTIRKSCPNTMLSILKYFNLLFHPFSFCCNSNEHEKRPEAFWKIGETKWNGECPICSLKAIEVYRLLLPIFLFYFLRNKNKWCSIKLVSNLMFIVSFRKQRNSPQLFCKIVLQERTERKRKKYNIK